MSNELVSIVTPTYNSSFYIGATIESILMQTYTNWELLITDDCSDDGTLDIVRKYMKRDPRIKLYCLPKNSGAGIARNNSIQKANGRFIAFCDSDDRWLPDKLEKQLSFMLQKECALTYTSYYLCAEDGDITGKMNCKPVVGYKDFVKDNCIGCLSAIYDSKVLGKIFMPVIRKRQDWGLWLLIIQKCKYAYGLQEPLAIYRQRAGSVSANKFNLIKHNLRVYREVLHFSLLKSWTLFIFLFVPNYVGKKLKNKVSNI